MAYRCEHCSLHVSWGGESWVHVTTEQRRCHPDDRDTRHEVARPAPPVERVVPARGRFGAS